MKKTIIYLLISAVSIQLFSQRKLTVVADKTITAISPTMWGVFFEDINFGADGGLYAELVKNRSFEFPIAMMGWHEERVNYQKGSILIINKSDRSGNARFARVTINNVDASGSAMTPQKLLTNFYDKDFLYKLNGEKKEGKKQVQEIELTPTDKTRPFHKVYLMVDKNAKSLYSAKFLEKSGGRYSYTITDMKSSASVSDKDFTFDKSKYPGVEVVDLR